MKRIGIDVGGTNLKAGLVNERGEIVHTERIPLGPWEGEERFDDPFQQAEYAYSLIESEAQ